MNNRKLSALLVTSRISRSEAVVEALEAEGFGTATSADPEQLSGSLRGDEAILIVIDAGADTGKYLARLQEHGGTQPAIVLLDEADFGLSTAAYDAGAAAVLPKRLSADSLRARFRFWRANLEAAGSTPQLESGIGSPVDRLPDTVIVLSSDGTLLEMISDSGARQLFGAAVAPGDDVTAGLPGEVGSLVKSNLKRALRSRKGAAFGFDLGDPGAKRHFEARLVVLGRNRLMMIVRNLSDEPLLGAAARAPDGGTTRHTAAGALLLESFVSDAKLRERGLVVMVVSLEQLLDLTKRLGQSVRRNLLKIAARRIEDCLRSQDRLQLPASGRADHHADMARLGSDEFVIVLREVESRDAARHVADRIREAFENPLSHEGHEFVVQPKTGIALFPADGDSSDQLLRNARAALDEASIRSSESYEFYSNTMKFRALQRLDGRTELAWAIENDQLSLRYLPRVDLVTGRVAGLEALLRWEHPLRGVVSLDEVLPLAEATGLMRPLGEWVLGRACAQAAHWRGDRQAFPPVSVNLSEVEFSDRGLVDVIRSTLDTSGLPPAALELEVAEATVIRADNAERTLERLGELGVPVVLDNFGVGYSSLSRLTQLPVRAIKIDRSFVEQCQLDSAGRSVCSAIIALAISLGLTVIAEGVENAQQIDYLRDQGCHALQGFFFSEPLVAEDVPGFLAEHSGVGADGTSIDLDTIRTRFLGHGAI